MILNIITYTISELLSPLVETFMLIYILQKFKLESRFKYKYSMIAIIIEYTLCINFIAGLDSSKNLLQLVAMQLCILIIIIINYKGRLYKKIISQGLFIFIIIVGECIASILIISATDISVTDIYASKYYYSLAVVISKLLQIIFIILIKLNKKDIKIRLTYRWQAIALTIFTLLINIIIVEALMYEAIDSKNLNTGVAIIIYTTIIIIVFLVAYIFNKIIKETKRQAEQQQIIEQYKLEHKYTQELNLLLDNLRILKHDLKNHISCMWGLIETDNIEDFKIYLSNLTEEIEELNEDKITAK